MARYARPRTNRYTAPCTDCGHTVPAGQGILRNVAHRPEHPRWKVTHVPVHWVGSPVSGKWAGGCPVPTGDEGNPNTDRARHTVHHG